MKKTLVVVVFALAAIAVGQDAAPQTQAQPQAQPAGQPAQTQAAQPAQAPQQKKEIKDPGEYNAYVGAIQQQDPNAKISGLEAFLQQYPNSVVKTDALEALMGAYQQGGNAAKVADTAQRLLQADPDNVRALVVLAYLSREQNKFADAQKYAERGIQAMPKMAKPDGVSDADFQKQKAQMSGVLNSAAGFSALQSKDYANAQKYLRASVEANPNNLADVYPLALSYLTATPSDDLNGLFFIARAANLATDPKGKEQILKFGKSKYKNFHGSEEGWNELLAQTASTPLPPAGFNITKYVPPTPEQQAADLVKSKPPKEMSFAEWQLVLSAGKQEDKDTVWNAIKGVALQMVGQVIKSSPTKLEIAASVDDIEAKRADIVLEMTAAIPARLIPKEGQELQFEGVPVSYEPSPFVMSMNKGALLTKAPAAKPTPKTAPRKRPAH